MASKGGKLLQVLKRKVHLSSRTNKTSPDDRTSAHDVNERGRRRESWIQDEGTVSARHGQNSIDQLEGELLKLRRSLERKEKEMEKLKTEVSTLRITTAITSVQPDPQPQELSVPDEDMSHGLNHSDSVRSDASQLSCLDFSLASTGMLKFKGKIKTKISPASELNPKGGDQTGSILPDTAAAIGPRRFEINHVSALLEEEGSTTNGSASAHVQELDIADKLVGATKKTVDKSKAEISRLPYVEKHCHHGHSVADLKFPESVKEALDIHSTQSCVYDTYDFSDIAAHESRSPPKSTSSTEEQDDFAFPSPGPDTYLDSDNLFTPQTAALLKMANWVGAAAAGPKSSSPLANLGVDEKPVVADHMKDHEEVQEEITDQTENSLKVPTCSNPTDFSKEHGLTIVIPSREAKSNNLVEPMEDSLKVEIGLKTIASNNTCTRRSQVESSVEEAPSKVMSKITQRAVAAASRRASIDLDRASGEKSLQTEVRSLELDHNKHSKAMKSLRRVDSHTSSKNPDRISRSTFVLSLPPSPPASAQAVPHGGLRVPPRSLDFETKTRNVLEQARTVKPSWNKNEQDLESKALTIWRSDTQNEPLAKSSSFDTESLPLSPSHGSNSYAASNDSTSPRSREYATTTGVRHEGLSPFSSSLSSSAREVSPFRYSAGSQLLLDEPGWRAKSNGTERVRQSSFDLNRENSSEEIDLEEEIRQCLEQSRLLLVSDATSSDDIKHIALTSPISREASFSVLALSRRRRSMEKNRTSVRSIPEIQVEQQERLALPQEHLAIDFPNVDDNTLNIQTSKVDDYATLGERQRMDDNSIISLQRLNSAVRAYDKKYPQPAFVSEAGDSKRAGLSSVPHRSRFFVESNSRRSAQVT